MGPDTEAASSGSQLRSKLGLAAPFATVWNPYFERPPARLDSQEEPVTLTFGHRSCGCLKQTTGTKDKYLFFLCPEHEKNPRLVPFTDDDEALWWGGLGLASKRKKSPKAAYEFHALKPSELEEAA